MEDFYTPLNSRELLEVTGEDSEKFLQGQLTCDLNSLGESSWQLGAACNNKGRVYSSFRLLRDNNRFILMLEPGMAGITANTLRKYIPFYKANMSNISGQYHRAGYTGKKAQALLEENFGTLPAPGHSTHAGDAIILNISVSEPRYEVWFPGNNDLEEASADLIPLATETHWQIADLKAGFCMVKPEFVEAFTPEELNMDLAGFISFNKGCYTGQEIVARMHYKGKGKKRLYLVSAPANTAMTGVPEAQDPTLGNDFNSMISNDLYFSNVVLNTEKNYQEGWIKNQDQHYFHAQITPYHYP